MTTIPDSGKVSGENALRIGLTYDERNFGILQKGAESDPNRRYRRGLNENGAQEVVLSPAMPPEEVEALLPTLHGLLLPGGCDVDPKCYGEEAHPKLGRIEPRFDAFEFRMLDYAAARNLPVFAICRGHQVLNVYYGGSLIQDIPDEMGKAAVTHEFPGHGPGNHDIAIEPASRMRDIFGVSRASVNTYHHQSARVVGKGLKVTARSDDGVIEAIELDGPRYVLGVQFHPEKTLRNAHSIALFVRFVAECARNREG